MSAEPLTARVPPFCADCGAEVIEALTPAGRAVKLDVEHVWVLPEERWPADCFVLAVAGRRHAVPQAIPAVEILERRRDSRSGPFRREHACER